MEQVRVIKVDTGEAQTSVKELRSQLKQLKDTMLSVEEGTEEYNNALQQAANIQHTLKEQMEEVNASAMDFGQIAGNVVKGVGGIVAGFQAAKATMNLFGIENETVIKSLERMQNLMALTQAIPAIEEGGKAFKRLGSAIKAGTAGLSGFKKALISTGIGAAVVAVGLLAANFDKLKSWITGTNEELEKQKKLQMDEHLKKVNDELGKRLSLEEQIRKAGGQDDLTIAEERVKSIEKEIKKKEALIEANRREAAQAYIAYNNAIQQGKAQSYINKLKENWLNISKGEDVYLKEIESIRNSQLKTAKEELEIEKKLQMDEHLKKVNDELSKRLGLEEQIRKAGGQDDVTIAEERVKSIEKEIKKKEALIEANGREAAQAWVAYNNAVQAGKAQSYTNQLKEKAQEIDAKEEVYLKDIETIRNGQLKTAKEQLEVEKKLEAARDIKAKQDEAAKAAEEARKTAEENRKKRIEEEKKAVEELRKKYGELAEDIKLYDATDYEKDLASLAKAEQQSIQTIEGALKKGIISKEQYEKDKLAIEKYYIQLRDNAQKEEAQRQREQSIELLDTTYQLEQAKLQKQYDDGLISEKDFTDRKKELLETYVQDYIDNIQFMLDTENGLTDEQILDYTNKINDARAKLKPEEKEEKSTEGESLAKGISEAINASALALNDFSDNPAWGNILKNVATLSANWDTLHKQIKEGGYKAFTAYAQIAAISLSAVAQLMNGLAAEQDTSTKEGFEQQKKYQIAGATMSMLSGIASAWASSMEFGPIAGPILGSILSAFMLATGIMQINKIKATEFNNGGSTSSASASPNTSAVNSVIAPVQYTKDVQGASIEGAIKDSRVFVVESDITNTQNKVSVTENEAKY